MRTFALLTLFLLSSSFCFGQDEQLDNVSVIDTNQPIQNTDDNLVLNSKSPEATETITSDMPEESSELPLFMVSNQEDVAEVDFDLSVFYDKNFDELRVNCSVEKLLSFKVIDKKQRVVRQVSHQFFPMSFEIHGLPAGIYQLEVYKGYKTLIRKYKIEKTK